MTPSYAQEINIHDSIMAMLRFLAAHLSLLDVNIATLDTHLKYYNFVSFLPSIVLNT